jgi:hypothetical protein
MAPLWRENQLVPTKQNRTELKRRAHDLKNQDARVGSPHSPTQGFNLLQMSPNWFLGILDTGPYKKWAF